MASLRIVSRALDSDDWGPKRLWRERVGVEPTGAGTTDAHTVLKTGEATRPRPPPPGIVADRRYSCRIARIAWLYRLALVLPNP